MKKLSICVLAVLIAIPSGTAVWADGNEQVEFDIFDNQGALAVWLDLSPLVSAKRLAEIKDGIGLAIDYRVSLHRPRRLWGSEKIAQLSGTCRIGYRLGTDDFHLVSRMEETSLERRFISASEMHRFLADSVTLDLTSVQSLDQNKRYYVEVKLTCVSLTSLNVAESGESPQTDQSAMKWLFESFLDLTNFGREDYQVRSRLFSLSELTP